mmetsp:Transcript_35421/g.46757  ORF Transcript_35421/g.46757 Transcript_35421/m.46757 type:complete len:98 (-) Transcript_35421:9-302(-)
MIFFFFSMSSMEWFDVSKINSKSKYFRMHRKEKIFAMRGNGMGGKQMESNKGNANIQAKEDNGARTKRQMLIIIYIEEYMKAKEYSEAIRQPKDFSK